MPPWKGKGKRERTPQTMIASIKIAQSDTITFSGHVDKTVSLENPSLHISYCRQSGDHAHQKARCEIPQRSPQPELKITSGNQGEYCVFSQRCWRLSPYKDRLQEGLNDINWYHVAGMFYCCAQVLLFVITNKFHLKLTCQRLLSPPLCLMQNDLFLKTIYN